jgi:hypothetical protein
MCSNAMRIQFVALENVSVRSSLPDAFDVPRLHDAEVKFHTSVGRMISLINLF